MNELFELWLEATSGTACRQQCSECRKMYGMDGCPSDATADVKENVYPFIKRVTAMLRDRIAAGDKDIDITEEEFADILGRAAEDTVTAQFMKEYMG